MGDIPQKNLSFRAMRAARALLSAGDKMPRAKIMDLKDTVLHHFRAVQDRPTTIQLKGPVISEVPSQELRAKAPLLCSVLAEDPELGLDALQASAAWQDGVNEQRKQRHDL